jgi:hypothetical protein
METDLKEEAKRLIDNMPRLTSWDELMYEIYVRQTIEAGLADSEGGRTETLEAVRARYNLPRMPRYDMSFGVGEAARIFQVHRDVVTRWAYHFSDYLGPGANPPKGMPRKFSAEDLRVLAYVFMYWEDEPDLECIRIGLNTNSHFEQPYDNLMTSLTPLFHEPPENLDETWRHGAVIGGMAAIGDVFFLAESYKLAGDKLVDAAISTDEVFELIYPVIYNYRHATELYLKASVLPRHGNHDLLPLLQEFKKLLQAEFDATVPEWFESVVIVFHDFDRNSTTFRYGGFFGQGEVWVDLAHMKTLMGWLAESFQKIRHRGQR